MVSKIQFTSLHNFGGNTMQIKAACASKCQRFVTEKVEL